MKKYIVYMHKNKINGKVYVGLTCQLPQERWRLQGQGYKNQIKFYRAIEKYGWDNFEHLILFNNLTENEASEKEKELIQVFDAINNGYNVSLGGSTTNHSPETLEKIRLARLGKKHSEQSKTKIRKSKSSLCKQIYCIETGETFTSLGEAAQKTGIDKTSLSRCCAKEQITAGGYHWAYQNDTEPEFATDKRKGQPILCITTGIAYKTLSEAARATNSDVSNIRKVCIGKYKSTKGKQWKYITEEEYQRYQGGYTEDGEV